MPFPDDAERLAVLERAVAELQRDVRELRAALGTAPVSPPPPPGAHPPIAYRPQRASLGARAAAYVRAQAAGLGLPGAGADAPDVEALVGRYATVAVAALLILTGVGAFLTWAVNTFTITPPARVAMGVVLAAALAGAGWRLRGGAAPPLPAPAGATRDALTAGREGTRRFGDVLLALALAVSHVNAWAAGPYLGLVTPAAALALAAAASAALAVLAWRAGQQALFVVGVGGALVAPFVTGSATGRPVALFAYGWVVLAAGTVALPLNDVRAREWRLAVRVLALGGAAYTVALLSDALDRRLAAEAATWGALAPWWRTLPALFPLAGASVPLLLAAWRSRHASTDRPTLGGLALAYAAAASGALLTLGIAGTQAELPVVALALASTFVVYAGAELLHTRDTGAPARRVLLVGTLVRVTAATATLVLPLVLLAAALLGVHEITGWPGATTAGIWAAVAALAAWRTHAGGRPPVPGRERLASAHVAVAGLASALVPVLALPGHDVVRATLLAAHAAGAVQLFRVVRRPLTLLAPLVVGCVAAGWAGVLLVGRPDYHYTPFLTPESLAAGATVAAWYAMARRIWGDGSRIVPRADRRLAVAAATIAALLWGRQEFAEAVSPDVSTFLLIGYFAVTGIAAIALGRARAVPAARQVGLALALYAALKAFVQASAFDVIGLRVGSYLLVGGFLLAVGYWYRAAGERTASGASTPPDPPVPTPGAA